MVKFSRSYPKSCRKAINMANQSQHKLSRRDALKILGAAAGASVLANLPSKWTKPEIAAGVLPAHAQTSGTHTVTAGISDPAANFCSSFDSTATITPPDSGIPLHFVINTNGNVAVNPPLSGTINTNGTGTATLSGITIDFGQPWNDNATITVTWSFENPSDGTGSSTQSFTDPTAGC